MGQKQASPIALNLILHLLCTKGQAVCYIVVRTSEYYEQTHNGCYEQLLSLPSFSHLAVKRVHFTE